MDHRWARLLAALGLGLACLAASARNVDFGNEEPSRPARHVASWAVDSGDHAGQPFAVVDKVQARVFVFDGNGVLIGAAPALLGLAQGDAAVPGIGQRKLADIRPAERTTPAGRFVATLAASLQGDEILWIDYESAVAMHRVLDVPRERRLQRLEGRKAADRRITFGCINVPVRFFDQVVAPAFRGRPGIVYVLPETQAAQAVFGSYEVPGAGAVSR